MYKKNNIANFSRKIGSRDKKPRRKWGMEKLLGVQRNKDGTKVLNKREEISKGALGHSLAGIGLSGLGYGGYKGALHFTGKSKKFIPRDVKMLKEYGSKYIKPTSAIALTTGLTGIGALRGYLEYKNKRKIIQEHKLRAKDR